MPGCRPGNLKRRGAVLYLTIFGLSSIVAVAALYAIADTVSRTRRNSESGSIADAGALAYSAVERAIAIINTNPAWRTTYLNNVEGPQLTLGSGTISWKVVDPSDNNLSNDPRQPVRIYGIGRIGPSSRMVSVLCTPGGAGLAVLGTSAHSAGPMMTASNVTAFGGPLSSNLSITLTGALSGDVQAPVILGGSNASGQVQSGAAPKMMPSDSVWDTYAARATAVSFSSFPLEKIKKTVLSPTRNEYGAVNPDGIYLIDVPATKTFEVTEARIVGTLLINLGVGATFMMANMNLHQPAYPNYPSLIIRAAGMATVKLEGLSSPLNEGSDNYNPPGTPYPWPNGVSDNVKNAIVYPGEQMHGVVHIIGPLVSTQISNEFRSVGTIIANGGMSITTAVLKANPNLISNPPDGYIDPSTQMIPVRSSWRLEAMP